MAERSSQSNDASNPADAPDAEFVQLFTKSQRRLYLAILAQVPNPSDAEEILQETNLVIWRKCSQFEPGTNFLAWATQISRYEVLKFRERRYKDRIRFSDEFVKQVADDTLSNADQLEERRKILSRCLSKLREKDRQLIQRRYAPGHDGQTLAEMLGRPVNSVYQSLGRIRRTLLECVNRELSAEART